jgi:hypothetical protein
MLIIIPKEGNMFDLFGWDTAGGIALLLAGIGVFFWGLHYVSGSTWKKK